jgi:hypothetical protein
VKSDNPLKHFTLVFVIALIGYWLAYYAIEHRRNRKGPWSVTFANTSTGVPTIMLNQPALRLTNVQISFMDRVGSATDSSATLSFSQPREVPYDVPFGKCIFMDTTFLPGTVTFQLLGHEIELLPRILIIDHSEYPWHSNTNITLRDLDH